MVTDKYLAMLSPLKNRAMSWSEDCHGSPLALITVLSHTFSILLLAQMRTKKVHVSRATGRIFGFGGQKLTKSLPTKCRFQIFH